MRSGSSNPIIGWTAAMFQSQSINWRENRLIASVDIQPLQCYQQEIHRYKMSGDMMRFTIGVICMVVVLLSLVEVSEANYKNAPMNGIMFGKRGPTEYDQRGKTLTALCEIATEACQAWFPSPENK